MLPPAASIHQYDGLLTLSFRLPLQASSSADVFSFVFEILAVEDTETRLTESIEEGQDSAAVRRVRERAAALGATTVTVLAGSPASGPDVTDYPGQRQLCGVRTAGTAAAPASFITRPAAYSRLVLLRPGETPSACGAHFRSGTASPAVLDAEYPITVRAMDRYGNVIAGAVDTVALSQTSGPSATLGPKAALLSGSASIPVTYHGNGMSVLVAVGRRNRGSRLIQVAGPVPGIAIVQETVTSGATHSCGLTTTGAAYCWGRNSSGQLGDGTTTDRSTPVAVAGGLTFASLSAGLYHTVALTPSGDAYAWGGNGRGQLGDGTTTDRTAPVPVAGGLAFVEIDAGGSHTVALTPEGEAYAWGWNYWFQLGDGTVTDRAAPVSVKGGLAFASISAGSMHTVALTPSGTAYAWGSNNFGQLGTGGETDGRTPQPVTGGLTFERVDVGASHTVALTGSGLAYAWGQNTFGQLGDGTTTTRRSPVAVKGGLTFASIVAGGWHTLARTSADAGYGWGYNFSGQLGDGTTTNRSTPVPVASGLTLAGFGRGTQTHHTLAITRSGAAYGWGENASAQLGDGSTTNRSLPVAVAGGLTFAVP